MHSHLLQDIGLSIIAATVLAYIAQFFRQPLLLAYLVAGVIIGPIGFRWVQEQDNIQSLAEIGLAFMLFIVGLEIDLKKLLTAGKPALAATLVQVVGSVILGWIVATALGYTGLPAMYLGAAVAFSSTMIVIKLLTDRGEMDTLPGRLTLAILLLQDVFAIIALAVQPSLGQDLPIGAIALAGIKGLALLAGALLVSRYVLPLLFRFVSMQPELLLLSALTWCFTVCFAAIWMDFSLAMGALIAGMSISTLPYTLDVVAKIRSLRDFFVTLFFVSLGMLMAKPTGGVLAHAAILSAVVLASRFLFIWPTLRLLGQDNRVGLLSSIHLSQSSEFGLLIALLGISFSPAHITQDVVSLVVIMLVITSTFSTYLVKYSHALARLVVRGSEATPLKDRLSTHGDDQDAQPADVMLIGCYRVGASLVPRLLKKGVNFSVVDFNIVLHDKLRERAVRCIYGDISHADTLEHAGVRDAKVLVCTVSDDFLRGVDNRRLLQMLRRLNPKAAIVVTAQSARHALQLYEAGADHVVLNRELAANHAIGIIESVLEGRSSDKRAHIAELEAIRVEEI